MLKEVALLISVLWCTQAFPAATIRNLSRVYCDAELLFRVYENGKHLPLEMRKKVERRVPLPSCNFTKAPERKKVCEIIQTYHELFTWLNKTKRDDSLLKPLMVSHRLSSIVKYQGTFLEHHCQEPNITQIEYPNSSRNSERENEFYYTFEQYKYCTLNLWKTHLTQEVHETNVCGNPPINI